MDPVAAAAPLAAALFDVLLPLRVAQGRPTVQVAWVLGCRAGAACRRAALAGLRAQPPGYAGLTLVEVRGANGRSYLTGEAIDLPLLTSRLSFWSLVAGVTEHLGAPPPDVAELVGGAADRMGTAAFERAADLPDGPDAEAALALGAAADGPEQVAAPALVPVAWGLAHQRLAQTEHAFDPAADLTALARVAMLGAIVCAKRQPAG